MLESLFNKVAAFWPATLLKETPTQVFSFEYCDIIKNTYFEEHLRTLVPEMMYGEVNSSVFVSNFL